MAKRDVLSAFNDGLEYDANGVVPVLNIAWSTVQENLRLCTRQKLLRRQWDGVRYLYSLTQKGADRLDFWSWQDEQG